MSSQKVFIIVHNIHVDLREAEPPGDESPKAEPVEGLLPRAKLQITQASLQREAPVHKGQATRASAVEACATTGAS